MREGDPSKLGCRGGMDKEESDTLQYQPKGDGPRQHNPGANATGSQDLWSQTVTADDQGWLQRPTGSSEWQRDFLEPQGLGVTGNCAAVVPLVLGSGFLEVHRDLERKQELAINWDEFHVDGSLQRFEGHFNG
ncbi:hypothetical protein AMTR_s00093p00047180 [Amborella trichopoda]|uniref:Uncharacterized protein n=1 Tax=Amborella trichopoda TaxID=13333 RepID=W1NSU1_AMBTC|nr:hypothetical protein AMTR_s00093p00047180 [Amborella trichopoda]